jgi:circadian clock protein KaiB
MNYKLRLYITGRTWQSQRAIENLRQICEAELQGRYEIEVIDVLEHPHLAEHEKILATPTLVKQIPEPVRKIIGDLSNHERLLLGLDLSPVRRVESARSREPN